MRWSFHLARIAGIEVRVHFTFLLLLAFLWFSNLAHGGVAAAVETVLFVCLVFLCVLLHEFGHAMAARRYGIRTPDITLLPIGGVARLERMPEKPSEELVIAIAGPLVNVAIAILLLPFAGILFHPELMGRAGVGLLPGLLLTNIGLVLFNLIPAFPMDGGRVLRALLAMRMDYARATGIAASIGQAIAVAGGLSVLLFKGPPMLVLVAVFIFFGAQSEASLAQMKSLSSGLRVSSAMVTQFTALPQNATLHDAVEAVISTSQHDFPVTDSAGTICGVLTREDLIVALRQSGAETPVTEVMRTDVPSIHHMMHFDRAFAIMQESGSAALPVVDTTGKLVGLFTPENVGQLMMLQNALAKSPRRASPPPLPVS